MTLKLPYSTASIGELDGFSGAANTLSAFTSSHVRFGLILLDDSHSIRASGAAAIRQGVNQLIETCAKAPTTADVWLGVATLNGRWIRQFTRARDISPLSESEYRARNAPTPLRRSIAMSAATLVHAQQQLHAAGYDADAQLFAFSDGGDYLPRGTPNVLQTVVREELSRFLAIARNRAFAVGLGNSATRAFLEMGFNQSDVSSAEDLSGVINGLSEFSQSVAGPG